MSVAACVVKAPPVVPGLERLLLHEIICSCGIKRCTFKRKTFAYMKTLRKSDLSRPSVVKVKLLVLLVSLVNITEFER